MSLIKLYNDLNGRKVKRIVIERLHTKLFDKLPEENPLIETAWGKLGKLLENNPKATHFELEVKPLKTDDFSGLNGISENEVLKLGLTEISQKDINDFGENEVTGLNKSITNEDIYQMVTDKIINAINTYGDLTWYSGRDENPKHNSILYMPSPINYNITNYYRGINAILLSHYPKGYEEKVINGKKIKQLVLEPISDDRLFWMTFKQIKDNKATLRKGAIAMQAIYYNFIYKYKNEKISEDKYKELLNKFNCPKDKNCKDLLKIAYLRYYNVFNERDIQGIDFDKKRNQLKNKKQKYNSNVEKIDAAEHIISTMPNKPRFIEKFIGKGDSPNYHPVKDIVEMPLKTQYKDISIWYGTAFHELVHSTGHEKRLSRKGITDFNGFGTEQYAFEELIAELGSAFLNAQSGILLSTIKKNAAYIKGWKKQVVNTLKKDNKAIFIASGKAQTAADYILNQVPKKKKRVPIKKTKPKVESNNTSNKKLKVKKEVAKSRKARQKKETGLNGDLKPVSNLVKKFGFMAANETPKEAEGVFTLPGEVGKFLQNIQPHKALILIKGTKHTSKSQLAMRIANAFGEMGWEVPYIDYEQGGLESKDTVDSINRNTTKKGRKNIYVIGYLENPLENLEEIAKTYNVLIADSVTDLKITADQLNYLRNKYPETIWIFISQVKENGTMYGGNKMAHNPTAIIHIEPNHDYTKRIATLEKNRGNDLSIKYNIFEDKVLEPELKVEKMSVEL